MFFFRAALYTADVFGGQRETKLARRGPNRQPSNTLATRPSTCFLSRLESNAISIHPRPTTKPNLKDIAPVSHSQYRKEKKNLASPTYLIWFSQSPPFTAGPSGYSCGDPPTRSVRWDYSILEKKRFRCSTTVPWDAVCRFRPQTRVGVVLEVELLLARGLVRHRKRTCQQSHQQCRIYQKADTLH